ncbi:MAG: At domain protein [Crocinitomicaceae bacterium]|jgi:hypothetical protein|nr:At domain protein [Crocinitomicaceae bacterium]
MKNNILLSTLFLLTSWAFQAQDFKAGETVMALENDDLLWYKATILETGSEKCKIHWEGFSSEYDEFINNDSFWKEGMPFLVGDKLQGLETDGKWYNAKVLEINGSKYFIHWGGFSSEYDRWISYDSLRLPTKENYIAEGNFNTNASSTNGSSYGSSRIGIIYLENKTGQTVKYTYSGDGSSGGGTIYNNQKDNIKNAPIGGEIKVNGTYFITISKGHDGQTVIIK